MDFPKRDCQFSQKTKLEFHKKSNEKIRCKNRIVSCSFKKGKIWLNLSLYARIPFDIVDKDPFYSESNMKFLEEGAAAIKAGKGVVHELIEVEGDDEEKLV